MQAVVDWINVNGNAVLVIITFITLVICTILGIVDSFKSKKDKIAKTSQIEIMTKIAEKDTAVEDVKVLDSKTETLISNVDKMSEELKTNRNQNILLGQMLGIIFENSTLSPEVKAQLSAIRTKMEYGVDTSILENLNSENLKLKEALAVMTNKEQEKEQPVVVTESKETKKYKSSVVIQ